MNRLFLAWPLIVGITYSCGEDARRDACASEQTEGDVAGRWSITGQGEWDCADERQNASFELNTPDPFDVVQTQGDDGSDALRIDDVEASAGFVFSGSVDGSCVDFSISERDGGQSLALTFSGSIVGSVVEGEFSGSGPNGCAAEGEFSAVLALENACADVPCANGGQCIDTPYGFECACATGFTGPRCERTDECTLDACANGGTCIDEENGFSCECAEGFSGPFCQDIDDCVPDPCTNGGRCIDEEDGFRCACPVGFTGDACESDIDECSETPSPCGSARCENTAGSFECICTGEAVFDGVDCEVPLSDGFSGCGSSPPTISWLAILAGLFFVRRRLLNRNAISGRG
ncbi:MAG: hypothetical protein AAFP04_03135 [Myxococcota bacterium]